MPPSPVSPTVSHIKGGAKGGAKDAVVTMIVRQFERERDLSAAKETAQRFGLFFFPFGLSLSNIQSLFFSEYIEQLEQREAALLKQLDAVEKSLSKQQTAAAKQVAALNARWEEHANAIVEDVVGMPVAEIQRLLAAVVRLFWVSNFNWHSCRACTRPWSLTRARSGLYENASRNCSRPKTFRMH
jgi:hypothetical protein